MTTPAKTRTDRRAYEAPRLIVPEDGMLDPEGKANYSGYEEGPTLGPS